jgi:hypothetical protein
MFNVRDSKETLVSLSNATNKLKPHFYLPMKAPANTSLMNLTVDLDRFKGVTRT